MGGNQYSEKLNYFIVAIIIILPIIVAAVLLYLTFQEIGIKYLYLVLLSLLGSLLGSIKFYNIPRELQVVDNKLKIKSVYGRELIFYASEVTSIEEKLGILVIRIKKDRIIGISKFPKVSELFDKLKKINPNLELKGIT